jgi:hypothetical protein
MQLKTVKISLSNYSTNTANNANATLALLRMKELSAKEFGLTASSGVNVCVGT